MAKLNRNLKAKRERAAKQFVEYATQEGFKAALTEPRMSDRATLVSALVRQPDATHVAGRTITRYDGKGRRRINSGIIAMHF